MSPLVSKAFTLCNFRPVGLNLVVRLFSVSVYQNTRLAEVGKLELPKAQGKYETGQLFLHRVFGYRGVILFPWLARVYDRDLPNQTKGNQLESGSSGTSGSTDGNSNTSKEVQKKTHTFYQVLIDQRDCPYIRAQTEAVTFLGNQESSRSLYAIPGLDYVAHEDILPYSSGEQHPLQHELFDKFLANQPDKDPPFVAQETLRAWQKKNHPWLELSDVHKETTEGIRVTVIPFYMGCRETPAASVYWWRYCIRLENLGELSVQLRERHWRIFSLSGTLETVRGRGVVGQEPVLSPRLPAFQYSSHVSLQAPSGHMWGTFRMEREDGHMFDCRIPPFSLESKPDDNNNSGSVDEPTANLDGSSENSPQSGGSDTASTTTPGTPNTKNNKNDGDEHV
ncbi:polymerase delta-interacting protein 2 [Anopheles ziemanni]|uniref:polymerase delta-interacting protein 2 n=1 Tax=Anopheles coustani TaxID=139045 RepID=UPI00265AFFFF|nr:polymerase delta-interacting protein 2 [Anopheles coustani]XP_058175280.1 polymerase delta-interacting protein 2 [Anopheles ziemanni]